MRRKLLSPTTALLTAATLILTLPLSAQRIISPKGYGPVFANTATGYPWGYGTIPAHRYQQVHDDLAGNPKVIVGIAVRRKEGGAMQWPAIGPELEVSMSTAAVTSQTATATYATNHGNDLKIVITKKIVNFPAVNAPGSLAAPFSYRMIFDAPFLYLGQGSVCYEIVCTNNNYTGATLLSLDLAQNNVPWVMGYGDGCAGATLTGTATLQYTANGLPPSSAAILMLGHDNESASGVALPLDLSAIGAPGCWLFVSPVLFIVQPTNASGSATFTLNATGAPRDVVVQAQVLAPSPAANTLGLVFTNGVFASPSVPQTFMRNWNSNITLPTGNLQLVYGLVTHFITP